MSGGSTDPASASLLAVLCILSPLWLCANGDLPKPGVENATVAVASTGEATVAVVSDGVLKRRTIQPATVDSTIRSFCHATCESSYNQQQIDDYLFIPSHGSINIYSGLNHPETASHWNVLLRTCDPVAMVYELVPSLSLFMFCRPGPTNNFSVTVTGVREMKDPSWSVIEPSTCDLGDTVSGDNAGLFFHSHDGSLYLAFASLSGLGLCNPKTVEPPNFITYPINCVWIAKLSQFDAGNIVAECTSGKNSQVVMVVWLFSILQGQFAQELPHGQYPLGQLTFSFDRLIGATWKGSTVQLKNLTGNNPPTATISASGVVDSVLIVGTGYNPLIVVATEDGVQKCDLHTVFAGRTECSTLEGSENILTRFTDPTCPAIQVGDSEDRVIIATLKGTTYGIAMLSLNGDKPVFIDGVRPARFAILPGGNATTTARPTVENDARNALYSITAPSVVICLITISFLVVIGVYVIQKRRRRQHRRAITNPVQEQSRSTSHTALATVPPAAEGSVHFPHSTIRSGLAAAAGYVELSLPAPDNDVTMLDPMEEEDNDPGEMSLAQPHYEGREAEGPPDGMSYS